MRRPKLITKCVADTYADKARERIAEFDGGLISFRNQDDGAILVNLYQLDSNVRVGVDPAHLVKQPAAALPSSTRHNVLASALAMDLDDRLTIIRALMESCGQVECVTLTAADVLDNAREVSDQDTEPFLTEDMALDACHEAAERDWTATYDQAAGEALRLLMHRARNLCDAAKVTSSTKP